MLLTRDKFREEALKRDNNQCVVCKNIAKDVHHIIERRLFEDGGYYLDNAASLCEECHILCEKTLISAQQLRNIIGIKKVILPQHLYEDEKYDKWGNIILPNGSRLKGELFHDESVQKILKDVMGEFAEYIKYPRTYHLPWSPGMNDDDKMHSSTEQWNGKIVVLSKKMDGENTTEFFDLLDIPMPEVLYMGEYNEELFKQYGNKLDYNKEEGYVLRLYDGFSYRDFKKYVGKYVRPNHVQTTKHHWATQQIIPNSIEKQ